MRAARRSTPSLRLGRVVTGTSRLPAPFEPNPTLLRPPLPSQCPTESRERILPHPVSVTKDNIQSVVGLESRCYELYVNSESTADLLLPICKTTCFFAACK
jgi:hypothetical protein